MSFNNLSEGERRIYEHLDYRGFKTLSCLSRELNVNLRTLIKLNALRHVDRMASCKTWQPRTPLYLDEEKVEIQRALLNNGTRSPFITQTNDSVGLSPKRASCIGGNTLPDFPVAVCASPTGGSPGRCTITPERQFLGKLEEDTLPSDTSPSPQAPKFPLKFFGPSNLASAANSDPLKGEGNLGEHVSVHRVRDTSDEETEAAVRTITDDRCYYADNSLLRVEMTPLTPPWNTTGIDYDPSSRFSFIYDGSDDGDGSSMEVVEEVPTSTFVQVYEADTDLFVDCDERGMALRRTDEGYCVAGSARDDDVYYRTFTPLDVAVSDVIVCDKVQNQANVYALESDLQSGPANRLFTSSPGRNHAESRHGNSPENHCQKCLEKFFRNLLRNPPKNPIECPYQTEIPCKNPIECPHQTEIPCKNPIEYPHQTEIPFKNSIECSHQTEIPYKNPIECPHQTEIPYKNPIECPHQNEIPYKNPIECPHQTENPYKNPIERAHQTENPYKNPIESPHQTENPYKNPIESPHQTENPYKNPIESPHQTENPYKNPIESPHQTENPYKNPIESLHQTENPYKNPIESSHQTENPYNNPIESLHQTENPHKNINHLSSNLQTPPELVRLGRAGPFEDSNIVKEEPHTMETEEEEVVHLIPLHEDNFEEELAMEGCSDALWVELMKFIHSANLEEALK